MSYKQEDSKHKDSFYTKVDGFYLTKSYLEQKNKLDAWEVYNEDVWIAGSPKTGTTWAQEMVWLIVNDLDYERAKISIHERTPHWEISTVIPLRQLSKGKDVEIPDSLGDTIKLINDSKVQGKPMCISTHMPFNLLPNQIKNGAKKPKIIYITRDPKDCVVSLYHYTQNLAGNTNKDSLEELATKYLEGSVLFGPAWDHTITYWNERHRLNLLILKYEEMVKDLTSVLNKLCIFLEKTLTTDQIQKLTHHLSFQSMKENPAANYKDNFEVYKKLGLTDSKSQDFVRKGKIGSYKEVLSPTLINRFNNIGEEKTKESGWKFV